MVLNIKRNLNMDRTLVFKELNQILQIFSKALDCKFDTPDNVYLDTMYIMDNKKPLFFGAAQIKKSYVSFHLMPIYVYPDLLNSVTVDLKKRMQGKSGFNFKTAGKVLFNDLHDLTLACFQYYKEEGFIDG